ncbi:aromatic amino acid lyase, partial [Micromonospora sp. D75]|nr:aromatic amino acid lyase [Micromonospora sp. D75]
MDLDVPLRIADLRAARDPVKVVVGAQARERVTAARTFLSAVLGDDRAVYGATTGFGALVG